MIMMSAMSDVMISVAKVVKSVISVMNKRVQ